MTEPQSKKAKPVDEIRLGNVRAAIWENSNEEGKVFFSLTIDVSYADKQGNWQQKKSFSMNECLRLEKVAGQVALRIQELNQEAANASRLDQAEQAA